MFREGEIPLEITKEEEKNGEFSPSQALIKEKSFLGKLGKKVENAAKIFLCVSCFAAGPGYTSEYSREDPSTVAVERVEEKKKDVRISKEALEGVVFIMAQARENLEEKYPGERNAMIINGLGRQVELFSKCLQDKGELIFKGDSTIVPDLSKVERKPGEEIEYKVTASKKEVARMRDEIGAILRAGKGLKETEALNAKVEAIIKYWENTERGKVLRGASIAKQGEDIEKSWEDREKEIEKSWENVEEGKELKEQEETEKNWIEREEVKRDLENFRGILEENLKGYPASQFVALDYFYSYIFGREMTGEICREVIKNSEISKPSNIEELSKEREIFWDKKLQELIKEIKEKGVYFTQKYSIIREGRIPDEEGLIKEVGQMKKMYERKYWADKLGVDKRKLDIKVSEGLMEEMKRGKW